MKYEPLLLYLQSNSLKENCFSQARLAMDAQVSLSSVKKIEGGCIGSFETFMRILRILGRLDIYQPLVEEERMSPNEYFEFVNSVRKKRRLRAAKSKAIHTNKIEESEW